LTALQHLGHTRNRLGLFNNDTTLLGGLGGVVLCQPKDDIGGGWEGIIGKVTE